MFVILPQTVRNPRITTSSLRLPIETNETDFARRLGRIAVGDAADDDAHRHARASDPRLVLVRLDGRFGLRAYSREPKSVCSHEPA
jgi:hypothetical protein